MFDFLNDFTPKMSKNETMARDSAILHLLINKGIITADEVNKDFMPLVQMYYDKYAEEDKRKLEKIEKEEEINENN